MGTEENKEIVKNLLEEINKGNTSIVDELTTNNFVMHRIGEVDIDRDAFKNYQQMVRKAFPDFKNTIKEILSEGNKVSLLAITSFTQRRHPVDVPLTENAISVYTSYYFRIEDNKIAEGWVLRDNLSYYQQHGVVPSNQEIERKLVF